MSYLWHFVFMGGRIVCSYFTDDKSVKTMTAQQILRLLYSIKKKEGIALFIAVMWPFF
jgi:hypothetical protein